MAPRHTALRSEGNSGGERCGAISRGSGRSFVSRMQGEFETLREQVLQHQVGIAPTGAWRGLRHNVEPLGIQPGWAEDRIALHSIGVHQNALQRRISVHDLPGTAAARHAAAPSAIHARRRGRLDGRHLEKRRGAGGLREGAQEVKNASAAWT